MEAVEGMGWVLSGAGKSQGVFDAVVVAHNGKCANRSVPEESGRPYDRLMGDGRAS